MNSNSLSGEGRCARRLALATRIRSARVASAMAAAMLTLVAGRAVGQNKPEPPPVDINDITAPSAPAAPATPVVKGPATTAPPPAAAAPAAEVAATPVVPKVPQTPVADHPGVYKGDGPAYKVGRFLVEWRSPHDQHPPADELLNVSVKLATTPSGYVAPVRVSDDGSTIPDATGRPLMRELPTVTIKLSDIADGGEANFYASALRSVTDAVTSELNRRGFIAIFTGPADDMIVPEGANMPDHKTGDDLRPGQTGDLRLVVWTGRVEGVRTVANGERLGKKVDSGEIPRVDPDDPVHNRIRAQSPIKQGDLVNRTLMDEYIFRLNRYPGRRVDAAIAAGSNPEDVTLDYMISENKPWTAYFQFSNTGTPATSVLRERFGVVYNQLTKHDDTLALDYTTGNFDKSHTVNLNYEFPLISDRLRLNSYGLFSKYDGSEVGITGAEFTGENWMLGSELKAILWQAGPTFLDGVAGFRWQDIRVDQTGILGHDNFFEGYVGVGLSRNTEDMTSNLGCAYYTNFDALNPTAIDTLGRPNADQCFNVLRFQGEQTAFLEPLFNRLGWFQGKDGSGFNTLANEVSASVRGQWGMNDSRLLPTEEEVAGGMFSVRGYPESLSAGDNVVMGSLEYRFHLPNYLYRSDKNAVDRYNMPSWLGSDFRYYPRQAFGRADWDLIFRGFFDWASVNSNDKVAGEHPDTLFSVGVGAEVLFRRNVSMRVDWGVALKDAGELRQSGEANVETGHNEVHFLLTLSY